MTHKQIFGLRDVGCYADGSFGETHRRLVLTELLTVAGYQESDPEMPGLLGSLHAEPSDDYSEEDEAIAWLTFNATEKDSAGDPLVHFALDCGDLILFPAEDDQ